MESGEFNCYKKKTFSGWQLVSFEESYKHKVENGISLFKQKLLKNE